MNVPIPLYVLLLVLAGFGAFILVSLIMTFDWRGLIERIKNYIREYRREIEIRHEIDRARADYLRECLVEYDKKHLV